MEDESVPILLGGVVEAATRGLIDDTPSDDEEVRSGGEDQDIFRDLW